MKDPTLLKFNFELHTFIYILISVGHKELISFILLFFQRYNPRGLGMLNLEEFKSMLESLAKRFGKGFMREYIEFLDGFNFQNAAQKDVVLGKNHETSAAFGPFVYQSLFDKFKTERPVMLSNGLTEFLTDFMVAPLLT